MFLDMRTSIDIPDELYKQAKIVAATRGITLKKLMIRGLQKSINELDAKPDASTLPTIPKGNRKPYDLSDEKIQALLAAEEASWYGYSS